MHIRDSLPLFSHEHLNFLPFLQIYVQNSCGVKMSFPKLKLVLRVHFNFEANYLPFLKINTRQRKFFERESGIKKWHRLVASQWYHINILTVIWPSENKLVHRSLHFKSMISNDIAYERCVLIYLYVQFIYGTWFYHASIIHTQIVLCADRRFATSIQWHSLLLINLNICIHHLPLHFRAMVGPFAIFAYFVL